ncbi:MAG: CDP-alcohol phosphatidyltransferase family protein, partial [Thermoprotei archaeon]
MLGKLRARYEKTMQPVGEALAKLGLSPNTFTLLSLGVSVIAALAFIKLGLLIGALLIPLVGFVDMLDGSVARATGRVTRF